MGLPLIGEGGPPKSMAIGQINIGDLGSGGTEMHGDAVVVSVYAIHMGMAFDSTSSPTPSGSDHVSTHSERSTAVTAISDRRNFNR
jgi:hypothetical protein